MDRFQPWQPRHFAPVTDLDLEVLEGHFRRPIPANVRVTLKTWGGMALATQPTIALPRRFRGDDHAIVAGIFGRIAGLPVDVPEWVPVGWLPIAADPGGDLFCLTGRDGTVVLLAHDDASPAVIVAAGFDAFLAALTAPQPA